MTPQAKTILKHLETHGSISTMEAITVYRVFRLSARIQQIRDYGLPVVTEMRKDASGKSYARYWHPDAPKCPPSKIMENANSFLNDNRYSYRKAA
jgi:hypothetical protein